MISVGSSEVLDPGGDTTLLLECVRQRARQYDVGIGEGESGYLLVTDQGNRTSDLYDFLAAQLEACADELGTDWRGRLSVPHPD